MTRILLVEDEEPMRRGLRILLASRGYEVLEAGSVAEAQLKLQGGRPQLLLLDVMLPGASGFELLATLRAAGNHTPVIMLTAKGAETDKVLGFSLGVDDYVAKPFSSLELLGRIEAVLRRSQPATPVAELVRFGAFCFDLAALELRQAGGVVELPTRALELLAALVRARGAVCTRDELVVAVSGQAGGLDTRTVDNLVVKLRAAIEPDASKPTYLLTVHGRGYRLAGAQP